MAATRHNHKNSDIKSFQFILEHIYTVKAVYAPWQYERMPH